MEVLERNWWAVAMRGVLGVLFGVAALVRSPQPLRLLVPLLGAWWVADGVFALAAALRSADAPAFWWPITAEGIAGIALGLAVYLLPEPSTLSLVVSVSAWFTATGAFRIVAAVRLREAVPNEWLMVVSGALSLAFAALVWAFPRTGASALVAAIGMFAIMLGVLYLGLAARLFGLLRSDGAHKAT
jgi:uncharacterized membrane protein HdeD (DUF308 family)